MTSLSGGILGVVKNKIKENLGMRSAEGAVPPTQNNNIENFSFYTIIKGAAQCFSGVPSTGENSPINTPAMHASAFTQAKVINNNNKLGSFQQQQTNKTNMIRKHCLHEKWISYLIHICNEIKQMLRETYVGRAKGGACTVIFHTTTITLHYTILPRELCSARYMLWSCVCPSVCLSICVSLCLCVCPSQVGVLLKWLNIGICKQRCTIVQGLQFSDAKNISKIRMGSPPMGAPNAGGVGRSWQISTNNSPYLENGTRQMHSFY